MMRVAEIMNQNVVTVEKGTIVMDALKVLVKHNFTGLPVVDDRSHIIGVISEKDVLSMAIRIHEKSYVSDHTSLLVEDFMTREVITLQATESFTALCSVLMKNSFRRVPIVLHDKLVGIATRKDVISYILELEG